VDEFKEKLANTIACLIISETICESINKYSGNIIVDDKNGLNFLEIAKKYKIPVLSVISVLKNKSEGKQ